MLKLKPKAASCPQCHVEIAWKPVSIGRGSVPCPHCGVLLTVSLSYWRILAVISLIGAVAIAWVIRIWRLFISLFGDCIGISVSPLIIYALWFTLAFLLIHGLPYVLSVPLQIRQGKSQVTTLGLHRRIDL